MLEDKQREKEREEEQRIERRTQEQQERMRKEFEEEMKIKKSKEDAVRLLYCQYSNFTDCILSDSPYQDGNAQFTIYLINNVEDIVVFLRSDNSFMFSYKRNGQVTLVEN